MGAKALLSCGATPRRRWPRYKVYAPVRVIPERPTKAPTVLGRGTELNQGGMTLLAAIELAVGDQVAVEFTPPCADAPVNLRCFVRNRYCYTYGLEFITENDTDYQNVGQLGSHLTRHSLVLQEGDPEAATPHSSPEPLPRAMLP